MNEQTLNSRRKRHLLAAVMLLFVFSFAAFYFYGFMKKMMVPYGPLLDYAVACLVVMLTGLAYCGMIAMRIE